MVFRAFGLSFLCGCGVVLLFRWFVRCLVECFFWSGCCLVVVSVCLVFIPLILIGGAVNQVDHIPAWSGYLRRDQARPAIRSQPRLVSDTFKTIRDEKIRSCAIRHSQARPDAIRRERALADTTRHAQMRSDAIRHRRTQSDTTAHDGTRWNESDTAERSQTRPDTIGRNQTGLDTV